MNVEDLRSWIRASPFVPSEVCLNDGKRLLVHDSSLVSLSGTRLLIASQVSDDFTQVPLCDIECLEPLSQALSDSSQVASYREVFARWERLRLWYNLILVLWTLCWIFATLESFTASGSEPGHHERLRLLILYVGMGAVIANTCFFAGPIAVTYVTWIGWRPRWLTPVLFAAGTLFTMLLAGLVVHAIAEPPF